MKFFCECTHDRKCLTRRNEINEDLESIWKALQEISVDYRWDHVEFLIHTGQVTTHHEIDERMDMKPIFGRRPSSTSRVISLINDAKKHLYSVLKSAKECKDCNESFHEDKK